VNFTQTIIKKGCPTDCEYLVRTKELTQKEGIFAGISAGWTWLVVLAVLTSVVSVYYYFRVLFHVWSPLPEANNLPSGLKPTVKT